MVDTRDGGAQVEDSQRGPRRTLTSCQHVPGAAARLRSIQTDDRTGAASGGVPSWQALVGASFLDPAWVRNSWLGGIIQSDGGPQTYFAIPLDAIAAAAP